MAGEKYAQRAVVKLASYIRSNYATHLRQVETDQGLAASSLTDLVEVLEADAPFDGRSPLAQVFAERWSYDDYQYKLVRSFCVVAVCVSGDADLDGLSTKTDRYATALIDCLVASSSLGDTVLAATLGDSDRLANRGAESTTHQVFLQNVEILSHEP